jgi:hypothetical protein
MEYSNIPKNPGQTQKSNKNVPDVKFEEHSEKNKERRNIRAGTTDMDFLQQFPAYVLYIRLTS